MFGQPELHEDDALRAVRAALELRERGRRTRRCGVEAGEVFVGAGRATRRRRRRPPRAARSAAAADGEILLGDAAARLLRGAVRAEPAGGAAAAARARPRGEAIARSPRAPFVGRARASSRELRAAFERRPRRPACVGA